MSYLKLCKITNEFYTEDCDTNIIKSNINSYPQIFYCEVIDWKSENDFISRKELNSFTSETVIIEEQPINIREEIFQQLLMKYPELIK